MDESKTAKIREFISGDKDIMEFVKKTEAGIETTRGHYGKYMAFLSEFDRGVRGSVGDGLVAAGASSEGVKGALMVLSQ